jgi:hypothetical protein
MKIKKLEARSVTRDYGFAGVEAIVETEHGLLLVCDGFGGMDTPAGGCVRWRHGMVVALQAGDTFASLAAPWNGTASVMDAAIRGYDPSRPVLDLEGKEIQKLADAANL